MHKTLKLNYMAARYGAVFLFFFLFLALHTRSYGQENATIKRDTTKGFDFFFNPGMYVGNKKNANYYRGFPTQESDFAQPDINYVLNPDPNNPYREKIINLIKDKYNVGGYDLWLNEKDVSNMLYSANFSFGIGARYRFTKNLSIGVVLTQALMSAHGTAFLSVKIYETNSNDAVRCFLVGKERRTAFELNAIYVFSTQGMLSPIFEGGLHVNNTKPISADLIVEEHSFNMMNQYGPDPYMYPTETDRKRGGVGTGFSLAAGLRITFNKWAAIEPVAQFRYEKVNLAGYDAITPNYNFMIRLVIGDGFFANRKVNSE